MWLLKLCEIVAKYFGFFEFNDQFSKTIFHKVWEHLENRGKCDSMSIIYDEFGIANPDLAFFYATPNMSNYPLL